MSTPFDLEKTQKLADLFAVPRDKRSEAWHQSFFAAVPEASLRGNNPQMFRGPDGFIYFFLALPPASQSFEPYCLSHILGHCLANGLGASVFGNDLTQPEWVFSYGDLSSYKSFGSFEGDPTDKSEGRDPEGPMTLQKGREVLTGVPSTDYLPLSTRQVLKTFLQSAGVASPSVILLMDEALKPKRNLVFNFFPEDFKNEKDYPIVMKRLAWFLPRGRGILGMQRATVQDWQFAPL